MSNFLHALDGHVEKTIYFPSAKVTATHIATLVLHLTCCLKNVFCILDSFCILCSMASQKPKVLPCKVQQIKRSTIVNISQ